MADDTKASEADTTQQPEIATAPSESTAPVSESKDAETAEAVTQPTEISAKKSEDKTEEKSADSKTGPEENSATVKDDKKDFRDDRKRKRYDEDRPRYQKRLNKNKSDYRELPESSDPVEIREQVEFYFSDSNLLQDKYLFEQTGGAENNPIPIKLLHSFKRMKHFQPYSAVVEALKESTVLDVVGDEVKRKTPLEVHKDKSREEMATFYEGRAATRSIYAKGFDEETNTTQLDLEEFFKPYGPVLAVRMRRNRQDNEFKRSVFVEFDSEETMQAFMDLDPKPKWDGKDLLIKTKNDYCQGKADDIEAGRIKGNESHPRDHDRRGHHNGRGRGRGNRGNRGRDDRRYGRRDRSRDGSRSRSGSPYRNGNDWKGRREQFQKGGYRDNRDRKGRNYDRRDERKDDVRSKQEYQENGIPIVRATSRTPSPIRKPKQEASKIISESSPLKANGDAPAKVENVATNAPETETSSTPNEKKRALDDDNGGKVEPETKKAKAEEVTATA